MTKTMRFLGIGLVGLLSSTASASTIQSNYCSTGTAVSAWAPIAGSTTPGFLLNPGLSTFLLTQVCSGVAHPSKGFSIETTDCFPSAGCTMTVEVAGGTSKPAGGNPRCISYDPGIVFPSGMGIQARDNNSVVPGGAKVTVTGFLCP